MRFDAPYSCLVVLALGIGCGQKKKTSESTSAAPKAGTSPATASSAGAGTGTDSSDGLSVTAYRCIVSAVSDSTSSAPTSNGTCTPPTVIASIPSKDFVSPPTPRCFDTTKQPPRPDSNNTCPTGYSVVKYDSFNNPPSDQGQRCVPADYYIGGGYNVGAPSGSCLPTNGACNQGWVLIKSIDPVSDDSCYTGIDHTV